MATCTPSCVPGQGMQNHGKWCQPPPPGQSLWLLWWGTRHRVPQEGIWTQRMWVDGNGQEVE